MITGLGSVAREVAFRACSAMPDYVRLKRPFFDVGAFSPQVKSRVLSVLLMSRMSYNASTWPELQPADMRTLTSNVCRFYRLALHPDDRVQLSDAALCARLALPSPQAVVARARLLLLPRLVQFGHDLFRALGQALRAVSGSWTQAVLGDMAEVARVSDRCAGLPPPHAAPEGWLGLASDHFAAWSAIIKRVLVSLFPLPEQPRLQVVGVPACCVCYCGECGREFDQPSRLRQHMARLHAYRHPAGNCTNSQGVCFACMRCFHTGSRLHFHLARDSPSCLVALQSWLPPLEPKERRMLDAADAATKAKARITGVPYRLASAPVARLPGPLRI